MKRNIIIILTILSVLTFNSFSHDGENHSSEHRLKLDYKASVGTIDPNGEMIRVNVKGLVCDFCARAIEKVFMKEKSVAGLTVNLEGKEIKIYRTCKRDCTPKHSATTNNHGCSGSYRTSNSK